MSFSGWRALTGVTLATLCVIAAPAQAEMVQNLAVTVKPPKAGSPRKPKAASIGITISSPTPEPATTQTVDLFLGKGLTFNDAAFPTCTQQMIKRAKGVTRCPRGSLVGRGSARAIGLFGGTQVPEQLKITVVNGPRRTLLLFVSGSNPVSISDALVGRLTKVSGRYGWKLSVEIPPQLREIIESTYAPLVDFHVDVKATTTVKRGRGRRARRASVSYVATTACPAGGSWPFRADFTFDQAAPYVSGPISAEATSGCN
jgi:hypothetical protein